MKHLEDNLQEACVTWFKMQYRQYEKLLFHISNGGKRNAREAARLKRMGVTPGVPDLFFAKSGGRFNRNGLFIEMKAEKGTTSKPQKEMQFILDAAGYEVATCNSFDQFISTIETYLNEAH